MARHTWKPSKSLPTSFCSVCSAELHTVGEDSKCRAARHSDPALDKLYRKRRKAAQDADGSGVKATRGWEELERITAILRLHDPKGDWCYEGNAYDGRGFCVRRPEQARSNERHIEVMLASVGDEQDDHDAIEAAAASYIDQGYEPVDSEPGEWLKLQHPNGAVVEIEVV